MAFKYQSLTPEILAILKEKGTEKPFTGRYLQTVENKHGSYLCRGCGLVLFRETSHFIAHCGWPSFDDQVSEAVKSVPDADGRRTEILCSRCHGHLGHVFTGEGYTVKNIRHCVNSLAIEFVADDQVLDTEEIILAAGCFWGVEHLLKALSGVLLTEVGYTGGELTYPAYEQVCQKNTGHYEAVRVVFNPEKLSLTDLLRYFFEIHDFTQQNGQGPDIGPQYRSAIFYFNDAQSNTACHVIQELKKLGYPKVATMLLEASTFWPAEDYHQHYYAHTGKTPYCHVRKRVFSFK